MLSKKFLPSASRNCALNRAHPLQVMDLKRCASLLDETPPDAYPTIAECCTAAYSPKGAWLDTTANLSRGCVYAADNCWLAPPDLKAPNRECVRVSPHLNTHQSRASLGPIPLQSCFPGLYQSMCFSGHSLLHSSASTL
jgi:hypothetical protein